MSSTAGLPAPVAAKAVAVSIDALVESVRGGSVRDLTHQELTQLVTTVRSQQARLEAVALEVVAEVDARRSFVHDGHLSAAAWLRSTTRSTPPDAAAVVRTARTLRAGLLPGTADALAAGEISARHAQTIADGVRDPGSATGDGYAPAEAVQLIEREVLEVARAADIRSVASVMAAFRHALDPDAADAAAMARYERRGLTLSPTLDGSMSLSGLADEVSGSVLATAIDAASPLLPNDKRTRAQIRIDALVEICRRFLQSPEAPTQGGGHPHVIVTVDGDTLFPADFVAVDPGIDADSDIEADPDKKADPDTEADLDADTDADVASDNQNDLVAERRKDVVRSRHGSPAVEPPTPPVASPGGTLSWVGRIGTATAQRVACDAELTTVVIGPDGDVVDTRTDRRFFTFPQRRAMIARDGDRCPWPWCDRPAAWSDGHHLVWWTRRGPTTIANGALPCTGHHPMLHEGGWTMHRLQDGRYVVTHRDGRVLGPEPHPPGHNRPSRPPPRRE